MPRTYWTKTGTPTETRFKGLPRYRTTVPENRLYDITADPAKYIKRFKYPNSLEKFLVKKGYIGYAAPSGEWQPFAIFEPLKAHRVQSFSIGVSPYAGERMPEIEKLYKAKKWEQIDKLFENDARKMLTAPNMNILEYKPGVGIYGGKPEPSPRLVVEYGGDYKAIRDKVSELANKYRQESAVISKKSLTGEKGSRSVLLQMNKELSSSDKSYLQRVLNRSGLGANIDNNSVLIHHISEFSKENPEQFSEKVIGFSEKIAKKLSHNLKDAYYNHDVIWGNF